MHSYICTIKHLFSRVSPVVIGKFSFIFDEFGQFEIYSCKKVLRCKRHVLDVEGNCTQLMYQFLITRNRQLQHQFVHRSKRSRKLWPRHSYLYNNDSIVKRGERVVLKTDLVQYYCWKSLKSLDVKILENGSLEYCYKFLVQVCRVKQLHFWSN